MRNIALIGFSGCGKTTAGLLVSETLGMPFFDSDGEVERAEGRSVAAIFAEDGEAYFRELEKKALRALSEKTGAVIATGGGCVKDPMNIACLKENCVMVYLESTPGRIASNLAGDSSRPLLKRGTPEETLERIGALMAERVPLYEMYADVTVSAAHSNVEQTAERIISAVRHLL